MNRANYHRNRKARIADAVTRWGTRALVATTLVFLFLPAVVVAVLSFSSGDLIEFPPASWGLDQYAKFIQSEYWLDTVRVSFSIALPVALLAVAIALPATLAINRTSMPFGNAVYMLGVSSILVPGAAFAVALFGIFSRFGLTATYLGIILAHTVLAVPITLVVLNTAIARVPYELDLVAMSLGASRARAWSGVTIRLLVPAIGAGALLAFITSFDEAVLITFLGGPGLVTLSKAIYDSVLFGVEPVITAISTLTFLVTGIAALVATRLNPRNR